MILEHPLLRPMLNLAGTNDNRYIFEIYQQLIFQASKEDQVVQLAEIYAKDPAFAKLYQEQNNLEGFDLERLIQLPDHTFGYHFAKHMKDHNLENIPAEQFKITDEWSFYTFRIVQTHDLWHILTGYHTDFIGEIGLGAFYIAQHTNFPSVALMTSFFLNVLMSKDLHKADWYVRAFVEGYERGRQAAPLLGLKWEAYFEEDITALRKRLNVHPTDIAPHPEITPRPALVNA